MQRRSALRALRDRLWTALSSLDGIHLNGSMEQRLPHNLNVRFDDVHGESLLKAMPNDVAVSSGAACATASAEPSHVLRAHGLERRTGAGVDQVRPRPVHDRAGGRDGRCRRRRRSAAFAASRTYHITGTAPEARITVSRVMSVRPAVCAAATMRPSNGSRVKRSSSARKICSGARSSG